MTERGGGSDVGRGTETVAVPEAAGESGVGCWFRCGVRLLAPLSTPTAQQAPACNAPMRQAARMAARLAVAGRPAPAPCVGGLAPQQLPRLAACLLPCWLPCYADSQRIHTRLFSFAHPPCPPSFTQAAWVQVVHLCSRWGNEHGPGPRAARACGRQRRQRRTHAVLCARDARCRRAPPGECAQRLASSLACLNVVCGHQPEAGLVCRIPLRP